MIHTDYADPSDKSLRPEMRKIMIESHPLKWIEWARAKNVRMFLAHGLRLDPESATVVNGSDNFIVGLGPDLLLQDEQSRLVTKTQNYLAKLFELFDEDKIAFNTDYRWNVRKRNDWNSLDWETPKRLEENKNKSDLSDHDLEDILYNNAKNFFKLY